ncbi:unnamed protein product [Polarella glacialis]|uniref:Uncharacterized protein n=1 Tax=Polarella glacialis TaxID=89957 RepID=A0A813JL80_POLGL|nr:unnamed protein product [Polarella glacialis]
MTMLVAGLPWEVLVGYRSLCRFRACLLVLGHKDGKRCQAAVRACIFCNLLSPDLWLHVLCCCPVFLDARASFFSASGGEMSLASLFIKHQEPGFVHMVAMARQIDMCSKAFWSKHGVLLLFVVAVVCCCWLSELLRCRLVSRGRLGFPTADFFATFC